MPNWTDNRLTITGPAHHVAHVLSSIKGSDDKPIDFHKIIPMPDVVRHTGMGARTFNVDGEEKTLRTWYEYQSWDEAMPAMETAIRPLTAEEESQLKEIGYSNWYDWSNAKWGTKWNAGDGDVEQLSPEHVEITFRTAWSPPEPIIDALRQKYPHCKFELGYRLEDDDMYPHSY